MESKNVYANALMAKQALIKDEGPWVKDAMEGLPNTNGIQLIMHRIYRALREYYGLPVVLKPFGTEDDVINELGSKKYVLSLFKELATEIVNVEHLTIESGLDPDVKRKLYFLFVFYDVGSTDELDSIMGDILGDMLENMLNETTTDIEVKPEITVDAEVIDDKVNHPSHYTYGNIECIDVITEATSGLTGIEAFDTGNAIKYLFRWKRKNGVEDLKKAKWYIDHLINKLGGSN